MNSSRLSTTLVGSRLKSESPTPFNLLVAYEDQATRDRALHLSHHLSKQLEEDYDFHCSWWKFDHLANAAIHEQAAQAATEANMIVLAMNAHAGLSTLQTEWIQGWLPRRRALKAALVALIGMPADGSAHGADVTTAYLRGVARSARLDFFSHSFELSKAGTETVSVPAVEEIPKQVEVVPEVSAPNNLVHVHFKMPIPRWGINE